MLNKIPRKTIIKKIYGWEYKIQHIKFCILIKFILSFIYICIEHQQITSNIILISVIKVIYSISLIMRILWIWIFQFEIIVDVDVTFFLFCLIISAIILNESETETSFGSRFTVVCSIFGVLSDHSWPGHLVRKN